MNFKLYQRYKFIAFPTLPAINRDIEVLRKMFNIAIDNGWLTKNPCKSVKKLRQENKLERYLTPEEEFRLLNNCTGRLSHLKAIIQFALNTGMRKEEILSLKNVQSENQILKNKLYDKDLEIKYLRDKHEEIVNVLVKELKVIKQETLLSE